MDFANRFRVAGKDFDLDDFDPGDKAGLTEDEAERRREKDLERLADLQDRLYAEGRRALLVVLQGLDAAGKDGTIKHVLSGLNPQGVAVTAFKQPSATELAHDFLWRTELALPPRGTIGVFNRSHYEEVLVVRVHPEILRHEPLPHAALGGHHIWKHRFAAINNWERYLTDNGFKVVKIFLNLSKEEQRTRLLRRIDLPDHNWKFSSADLAERDHWDEYQHAFSEMFTHTSTDWAPWYVIPGDRKWFARVGAAAVIAHALIELDPQYPKLDDDALRALEEAKARLIAEAPEGAAADPFAVATGNGKAS
jgi:PPK2 family polyphosphate:nucleotide phosphotransferase